MKELEKTKRISISAVLFLLIIIIAVLTFEKPKHVFENNTEAMLQEISNNEYILTLDQLSYLEASQYELIDVRSNFEYSKGFIKNAVNISTNDILAADNLKFLNRLEENNKTAVLYGENPDEANGAYMLLYQLGYENAKILCVQASYKDNTFSAENYEIEKPSVNFEEIMRISSSTLEEINPEASKKVITIPKKKKKEPEGGC